MKYTETRVQEAYRSLCRVMRHPQNYGLGPHVPPALAHVLEETLCTLSEITQERVLVNGTLEAELFLEADRTCLHR